MSYVVRCTQGEKENWPRAVGGAAKSGSPQIRFLGAPIRPIRWVATFGDTAHSAQLFPVRSNPSLYGTFLALCSIACEVISRVMVFVSFPFETSYADYEECCSP